ncbi:MAG: pilus assembly PilX N-terminal domain-containing protein [Desulfomicrobium sp.]|jgi:hypothetical protein|nr:pilus assembly PilX N-terminal domain-containing protein [Desulfomicrobium sp.]
MFSRPNTDHKKEQGSALVAAVIVLALLTALGFAALNVADLNINIAANDRDAKEAFFQAEAGTNIGHIALSLWDSKEPFGNKATNWQDDPFDEAVWKNLGSVLEAYKSDSQATYVRIGQLRRGIIAGGSIIMASGYRGLAYGGRNSAYTDFLIRSHRIGLRDSQAEIDLGWRSIGGR